MNGTEKVDRAAIRLAAIRARLDAEVDGYRNLQTRADTRALLAEVERFSRANETLTETAYSNVSVSGRVLPWSEIAEWQDRRIKTLTETVRRVEAGLRETADGYGHDGQIGVANALTLLADQIDDPGPREAVCLVCGGDPMESAPGQGPTRLLDGGVETDGARREALETPQEGTGGPLAAQEAETVPESQRCNSGPQNACEGIDWATVYDDPDL